MIEALFLASIATVAYTYAGYPAVLWLLSRVTQKPVARGAFEPRISVIVVAYNEAARIGSKIESCLALDYPKGSLEIILASDGSDDGTDEAIAAWSAKGVRLLSFGTRRGKAACLNDAVRESNGELLFLTDARQRLDPPAVRRLAENFADDSVGAASGELQFEDDGITAFGRGVDAYWRYEKFIRRHESATGSVIGVTGAIYMLRRENWRDIPPDTILDDVLIPMNVVLQGLRVVFDGRAIAYDRPSRESAQERSRKVRTLAGNYQLVTAHPSFLVPVRNPVFWRFLSHKLLRLAGPWLLAMALGTNVAMVASGGPWPAILALQLAAYGAGLAGLFWRPARTWWLTRLAGTFLALNWYGVLALAEFLRNRRAHLWSTKPDAAADRAEAPR